MLQARRGGGVDTVSLEKPVDLTNLAVRECLWGMARLEEMAELGLSANLTVCGEVRDGFDGSLTAKNN